MDTRGGRLGRDQTRSNWTDRDDDRSSSQNRFEKKEDKEKDNNKRATSRWTNSSPKSVVSDEENWDEDDRFNASNTKGLQSTKKASPSSVVAASASSSAIAENMPKTTSKNTPKSTPAKSFLPLPQTEPIDDDSQEDDFNDFDDSSPNTSTLNLPPKNTSPIVSEVEDINDDADIDKKETIDSEKPVENIVQIEQQDTSSGNQETKDIDMFADRPQTPQSSEAIVTVPPPSPPCMLDDNEEEDCYQKDTPQTGFAYSKRDINEENTTPLYDEPQDKQPDASGERPQIDETPVSKSEEVPSNSVSNDNYGINDKEEKEEPLITQDHQQEEQIEKKIDEPGIPGVDPIQSD